MEFFRRKLIFMELTGMGQCNQDAQDAVTVEVPVTDSVDAIVNKAIFNQLKERFNWDRPSSSFGADIYTELVAFITENIME